MSAHKVPLHRGRKGVQPEKPTAREAKAKKVAESKEDPLHPLRGGGMRKRVHAPRPSRSKGTDAWLSQQLDKDGFQHQLLMVAFHLNEDPAARLKICQERRATGQQHNFLPLRESSSKECTTSTCYCHAHYRLLAGKLGGMPGKLDGGPTAAADFVRARVSAPRTRAPAPVVRTRVPIRPTFHWSRSDSSTRVRAHAIRLAQVRSFFSQARRAMRCVDAMPPGV